MFYPYSSPHTGYARPSFNHPFWRLQHENKGDAFVDDSCLAASSGDIDNTIESAINTLQNLSQTRERGLFSTGGAINLRKSFWVLITWCWHKGRAYLVPPSLHDYKLALTAGYDINNLVVVPQISPYASYRTLGAYWP